MFNLKKFNSKIIEIMGYFIFFILALRFLSNKIMVYPVTSYFLTYENGFISRGFIGTIFHFFISDKNIVLFSKLICCIVLSIYILYIFINIVKITKQNQNTNFVFYLLFCFCSSFLFIYLDYEYYMRLDIFWLFLSIFIFQCFNNLKYWKIILIFMLSIIGIFTHQGFLFTMCPIICILFLDNKKYKTFFIYGISMICIFLICQFGGNTDYNTILNTAMSHAHESDMILYPQAEEVLQKMIDLEYKYGIKEHFSIIGDEYILHIKYAIIFCLTNSINLFFLFKLLYKVKYNINKKLYIAILVISQIPLLILTIDIERWTVLMILNLYMFLLYKIRKEEINKNISFSKKDIILFFFNIILLIIFVIYYIF